MVATRSGKVFRIKREETKKRKRQSGGKKQSGVKKESRVKKESGVKKKKAESGAKSSRSGTKKKSGSKRQSGSKGVAKIESLEETLKRTTQPALRGKLQEQIKRESAGKKKKSAGKRSGAKRQSGSKKKKSRAKRQGTKGWAARSPQRGKPRQVLKSVCGDAAFLLPQQNKFPIMSKCGTGREKDRCKCEIDCGGVQAAYNRARQWGYEKVAHDAKDTLFRYCF